MTTVTSQEGRENGQGPNVPRIEPLKRSDKGMKGIFIIYPWFSVLSKIRPYTQARPIRHRSRTKLSLVDKQNNDPTFLRKIDPTRP